MQQPRYGPEQEETDDEQDKGSASHAHSIPKKYPTTNALRLPTVPTELTTE